MKNDNHNVQSKTSIKYHFDILQPKPQLRCQSFYISREQNRFFNAFQSQ